MIRALSIVYLVSDPFIFPRSTPSYHSLTVKSEILLYRGAGLALRGPNGSVVRALYLLEKESQKILLSYFLSLAFFGVEVLGALLGNLGVKELLPLNCMIVTIIVLGMMYTANAYVGMRSRILVKELNKKSEEMFEPVSEKPYCCIFMDELNLKKLSSLDVCDHNYCKECIETWAKTENSFHSANAIFKTLNFLISSSIIPQRYLLFTDITA